jgi:hypothetical protein
VFIAFEIRCLRPDLGVSEVVVLSDDCCETIALSKIVYRISFSRDAQRNALAFRCASRLNNIDVPETLSAFFSL